jgi:hypothetical protein
MRNGYEILVGKSEGEKSFWRILSKWVLNGLLRGILPPLPPPPFEFIA